MLNVDSKTIASMNGDCALTAESKKGSQEI
jgi:hypothetical protein